MVFSKCQGEETMPKIALRLLHIHDKNLIYNLLCQKSFSFG